MQSSNTAPTVKAKDLTIRQAIVKDLEQLVGWTLKLHRHEDDGALAPHPEFKEKINHWLTMELENPASLYLIAETTKNAVGFIGASQIINDNGFLKNPLKGVIQLLWVEPMMRQTGIAKQLVNNVEHCFKQVGVRYVECTFTSHNLQASNFWSSMQYRNFSISARKILD
jgi:ribosomal protein S18 acetylase RimI-like enzyme